MENPMFTEVLGEFLNATGAGIPLFIETLFLLWFAKRMREWTTNFVENEQLFEVDNHAIGIAAAGYYIGIMIAITGVISGPSQGWLIDIRDGAIYGIMAILFQNIARWSADKFILKQFSIDEELIRDKNEGTAWAMFGLYFATGMVVRGAMIGESIDILTGLVSALVYFILGQLALIAITYFYQKITPYDFHEEIEKDNVAAGIAFCGFVSSVGVIIGHASGDSVTIPSIVIFICWTLLSLLVLSLSKYVVVEHILVPRHKITKEITIDRNENAAWMLVVGYQTTAWLFVLAV